MRVLAYFFLVTLFAKVMLIGYSNGAPQYLLPAILVTIVGLMIVRSARARALLPQIPMLGPMLLFLLVAACGCVVAAFNGFLLADSMTALSRILTMIAVLVGAALLAGMGEAVAGHRVLYATFVLHIAAAIVLYFAGVGYEIGGVLRPTGLTGRPQLIANIASLAIIYYLCRMLHVDGRMTPGATAAVILGLAFVALSGTLKNFVAVIVVAVLALAAWRGRHRRTMAVVGTVLLALAAYLAWLELPIGERLTAAIQAGLTADVSLGDKLESSMMWRALHWRLLLQDWFANYFWTGAGIGQVTSLHALRTDSGAGFIAHSDWIGLLVELGPILFAVVVLAHVGIYRRATALVRDGYLDFQPVRLVFLLFVLMATVGNILYSAAYQYQFWWLAGLAAGSYAAGVGPDGKKDDPSIASH
jgi:hypothetical protein